MKHFVISDRDAAALAEQFLTAVARCAHERAAGGFSPAQRLAGDLVCALHKTLMAELGLNRGGQVALSGEHKKISYVESGSEQIVLACRDISTHATERVVPLSIQTYQRLRRLAKRAGANVEARRV